MKKILILALVLALAPALSFALDYKILAIVNGESISTSQLRDRVQLVISSSGMDDTYNNKKKLTPEITDILINEVLQRQDAKQKNIKYSEAETKEILHDLEKRNGLKPDGFKKYIEGKGLTYESIVDQINASILWKKILGTYIRPTIEVTKADIEKAKAEKPKEGAGKNKVNISEIIIPIEFGKEQESKDLADTIIRTARNKAQSFEELAQKYSAGKTARVSGALGWVPEEGIVEPIASAVKKTSPGNISAPIKVQSLYVIIKVNDRQSLVPVDHSTPEDRALMAKMEESAKKYIKNLRDSAYIEKKYTDENLMKFVWGE